MGQTVTNFDKAFKIHYWDTRRKAAAETFFRSSVLMSRLRREPVRIAGRHIEVPVHTARTRSGGPRSEGVALPTATNQTPNVFQFTPISLYWPVQLTGQVMSQAAQDEDAFWKAVDFEVRNADKDMRDDMNRQLYGDGSGAIGYCGASSVGASTTVTLTDTSWLEAGMSISFLDVAAGTLLQCGGATYIPTISSVDHAAKTIVISHTVTSVVYARATTTGTVVLRPNTTDSATAQAYLNSMWGLDLAIPTVAINGLGLGVANTTYAGINRNAAASAGVFAQANTADGSGGVTEEQMMLWKDQVALRGGGKTSLIITSNEQWRGIGAELKKSSFWQNPVQSIQFGFNAIMWMGGDNRGGLPIVWDAHCPRDRMYLLDESTFYLGEMESLGWMSKDGQTWVCDRVTDVYKAMKVWRGNLICTNPKANMVVHSCKLGTPAF